MPTTKSFNQKTSLTRLSKLPDWIAGLSIAGLLLPEAVAYSRIANLPMHAGIIALFIGLICYGIFGKSRFAIVSATSSSAALLAASTAPLAANPEIRLVFALGLMIVTGILFLIAATAKLGNITDFIAKPVLRGFSFGLACVIIIKQFALVVDVHPQSSDMLRYILQMIGLNSQWNMSSLLIACVALGLLFWLSRYRYAPAGLVVIVLGMIVGRYLPMADYGVHLIGDISIELNAPSIPNLSYMDWMRLFELGIAMLLIIYAESYGSIRTFANKHNDTISPNRDLFSLGVANLLSGLLHGMPVGAGFSATAANESAGAVSKRAGMLAALFILLMLLSILPLLAYTPEPVLAAIVIHAVSHSLRLANLKPYFVWQRDRIVLVAAIFGVLSLGVLDGLLVSIGISLLMTLKRFSNSALIELGRYQKGHDYLPLSYSNEVQMLPNLLILRPNGPVFFANVEKILAELNIRVSQNQQTKNLTVILSLEETPDLDGTSLEALNELIDQFKNSRIRLAIARLKEPVFNLLIVKQKNRESLYLTRLSVASAVEWAQNEI